MLFFLQAEAGIRDIGVTGVQTCALPIWTFHAVVRMRHVEGPAARLVGERQLKHLGAPAQHPAREAGVVGVGLETHDAVRDRSEERRVGKECRSRWSPYH